MRLLVASVIFLLALWTACFTCKLSTSLQHRTPEPRCVLSEDIVWYASDRGGHNQVASCQRTTFVILGKIRFSYFDSRQIACHLELYLEVGAERSNDRQCMRSVWRQYFLVTGAEAVQIDITIKPAADIISTQLTTTTKDSIATIGNNDVKGEPFDPESKILAVRSLLTFDNWLHPNPSCPPLEIKICSFYDHQGKWTQRSHTESRYWLPNDWVLLEKISGHIRVILTGNSWSIPFHLFRLRLHDLSRSGNRHSREPPHPVLPLSLPTIGPWHIAPLCVSCILCQCLMCLLRRPVFEDGTHHNRIELTSPPSLFHEQPTGRYRPPPSIWSSGAIGSWTRDRVGRLTRKATRNTPV